MSREEIPWNRVAQEIIKILGSEAAKGLFYAMMVQSVYPSLAKTIRDIAAGKSTHEELRRSLEEIKTMLQAQGIPSQPARMTEEQLASALANLLRQQQTGLVAAPTPHAPPAPITPPAPQPPTPMMIPSEVRVRLETLELEINGIRQALQGFYRQLYEELDEAKRNQLNSRIQQLRQELESKTREYEYLKAQLASIR
ncbi:MAG: hypothetical protein QW760_07490 [Thermofilaceae archaeon]